MPCARFGNGHARKAHLTYVSVLLCAEEQRRQAEEQARRVSEGMKKSFEHDNGGVMCANC
jgi:hypothetical protein